MTTADCTPIIPGYKINSQLYAGYRTVVYRAIREQDQLPVVIKLLTSEYPGFNELLQFRNQYTISKNLNIPGIIQPLSLEPYGNAYILVMEDIGLISLGEYIKTNIISLVEFLEIAIQLTNIIDDLIISHIIHKDIKPANILIHPESKTVKLIDFSIASLLSKETQELKNPHILEGTLAYISPEQTGRMNRGIDYRSDFYSLGVTFYELLTGELPFISDDPMELVHGHIAKMPTPLVNKKSAIGNTAEIPQVVSDIVMKLMAKNAEERYQSALGLKHDLNKCWYELKNTGKITDFEIGQQDLCDRFLIPEKLYGREAEVKTLLNGCEGVANGTTEIMLVAGFSGIGKTAVVNEIHKPITRQQGYFIKGKFDQFNRNIPFSAFVQALRDLIGQLFSESDAQLAQWRGKILASVGDNGQVLISVIPELERIIGKQPPTPELSGTAAQNRFNLLFQKFIAVFSTAEHPLVMFLDDLQWADFASLELIKLLMEEQSYLLLLGAYRDNEVEATHPFILTVEELKKTGKIVNTITLLPLSFGDTNQLVADKLNCPTERSHSLTELIISIHASTTASISSNYNMNTVLDFAAIIKASQSLSSTIKLDELLHQLTEIILQNSGGDRCALILPYSDGNWRVKAMATPDSKKLCSEPLEGNLHVPVKLIQYVKNTQELVVINNLETELPVIDEYLIQQQPKSILCLPILNQGKLIGILYLHNRSTSGVFTSDRILILNFLCTQAAISLENARLYQQAGQALQNLQQAELQLVQSEKMFALGNLVAGVAHEMNNPLGFICATLQQIKPMFAEMLTHLQLYQARLPEPGAEILDHAAEIDLDYSLEDLPKMIDSMIMASDRLKNISTSLRTFSRADQVYQVPFNIHEGINSTILILKHRLKANEQRPAIKVITEYGNLPEIKCFPGQLNQVFMNILANAIDALEESNKGRSFAEIQAHPPYIFIKTLIIDQQVKIAIANNGIGMSEEVKQRIFDHLFTTKAVGKGTGLGLAIARQIVEEKHHGSLVVNSRLGEGTEFVITLPIIGINN
jgi:signal transduction histidine kinase/serine/threonine protein kinase